MWHDYFNAATTEEAIRLLGEHGERARIVAGATDLILELERGVRRGSWNSNAVSAGTSTH